MIFCLALWRLRHVFSAPKTCNAAKIYFTMRIRFLGPVAYVLVFCSVTCSQASGQSSSRFTDIVNVTQGFNVSLNSPPCCLYSYAITPLAINSSIVGQGAISSISITGTAAGNRPTYRWVRYRHTCRSCTVWAPSRG